MPKRYPRESRRAVCARLVAGERVVSPSEELEDSEATVYPRKRPAVTDAGRSGGVKSFEADELAQAQRIARAPVALLNGEKSPNRDRSRVVGKSNNPESRQMQAIPRKHTKFVTCPKHRWLEAVTLPGTRIISRQRRAEMFIEGGPSGEVECCKGGRCRIWPGTDLFVTEICHGEYNLDWTTEEGEA